jgi:transcriptional regulator with XRE-family HTH domain
MMTLADLIATRKRGDSYEALAERGGLSPSAIHKYASGMNKDFPPPDSVHQLATALDVTPGEIIVAAAHGLGFTLPDRDPDAGPAFARMLPKEVDHLPQHSKQAIIDVVRSLITLMYGEPTEVDVDPVATASASVARRTAARGRAVQDNPSPE